jgi:hypothetical protein
VGFKGASGGAGSEDVEEPGIGMWIGSDRAGRDAVGESEP